MSSPKSSSNNENIKEPKRSMDFDTILVKEIGQIGLFQYRILLVTLTLVLFRSWSTNEYVFTASKINTRCYIPGCDSDNGEYSPEWVLSAVPSAGGGLDNCQRYANTSSLPEDGTCPAQLFDSTQLQPCSAYVYENTNTVVYAFGLECDEWRRSLIGSVRNLGMFVALPLTGYMSDRWGRRTAMAITAFNAAWFGIMRYWAKSYMVYLVMGFVDTALSGGVYTSAYILACEMMGPKYRAVGAAFTNSLFSFGQVTLALIAMFVPYWKDLLLTLYIPQFLSIITYFVVCESVRWSMTKGHYSEAEALIKKMAKVNKRSVSEKSLADLRYTYEEQKRAQLEAKDNSWLLVEVYKNKRLLVRLIVGAVCWIANTFIYHGLTINATTISGNRYLNYAAVSAVEIPGFWIGIYLLNKIGRRPVIATGFFVCAASQAVYVFVPNDYYVLSLVVYLIGKFLSGMMLVSVYIYTTELFPTAQRHRFLASCSFMGRIGSVLAPLTPAFGAATFDEFPFVLFGSGALLSGFLILFLPETLNTKLPDTMEEAENIGKKKEKNDSA